MRLSQSSLNRPSIPRDERRQNAPMASWGWSTARSAPIGTMPPQCGTVVGSPARRTTVTLARPDRCGEIQRPFRSRRTTRTQPPGSSGTGRPGRGDRAPPRAGSSLASDLDSSPNRPKRQTAGSLRLPRAPRKWHALRTAPGSRHQVQTSQAGSPWQGRLRIHRPQYHHAATECRSSATRRGIVTL